MKIKNWEIEEKIEEHKKYYVVYENLGDINGNNVIKYYHDEFLKLQEALDYIKNRIEE